MDTTTLESLINNTVGSQTSPLIDINALLQPLMPYIIIFTVLSIVITVLYLISIIQKWRANAAIIEIRDILRAMHSQGKAAPASTTLRDDAEPSAT